MDWQPIETAPRDGTDVLLFYPLEGLRHDWNPQVVIAGWRDYSRAPQLSGWVFQSRGVRGYSATFQPTHWQPLPTPPSDGA